MRGINKKKFNIIKKHIVIFFMIFLIFAFLILINYSCPLRRFTGIPCPACGMSRAAVEMAKLNFEKSFYYNPVLLLLIPALLTAEHYGKIKYKKAARIFIVVSAVIIFLVYFYRLYYNLIP